MYVQYIVCINIIMCLMVSSHIPCSQVLSKESVSPDVLVDRHYAIPVIIKTIQRGLFQFTEELLKREATVRYYRDTHLVQ